MQIMMGLGIMMIMNLLSCRAFTLPNRHDTYGGHLEYKFLRPPAKPTRCLMSPITYLTLVTSGRMGRNAFAMVHRPRIEGKPSWENLNNSSQTLSRRAAVVPPDTGHVGIQPTTSRKHNQHPTNCANSPLKITYPFSHILPCIALDPHLRGPKFRSRELKTKASMAQLLL